MDLIEPVYKKEFSQILKSLLSKFGLKNKQLIEDSIQEAFISASQDLKFKTENDLKFWILRTASNKVIDYIRRENKYENNGEQVVDSFYMKSDEQTLMDSDLNQLFLIASQKISEQDKAILALYFVMEIDIKTISQLFLKKEKSIYQRILRTKNSIKSFGNNFNTLSSQDIVKNISTVTRIIYLIFTCGYQSYNTFDKDFSLSFEAIRLAQLLIKEELTNITEVRSLIALMLFQTSRIDAQFDTDNKPILLEEQDFSKWNKTLIQIAMYYLDQSDNYVISEYKLLAIIAAAYSNAQNFASINWKFILSQYDILVENFDNPIYKLNRLVVVERVKGTNKALNELKTLKQDKDLMSNYQIYLLNASLLERLDRFDDANVEYSKSLSFTKDKTVKSFIADKIKILEKRKKM